MNKNSYGLKVENLYKEVKTIKGKKTILENANFEVEKGEFVAVVGVSGAGKTTLINMLSGYDRPTKGKVYYNEQDFLKNENVFKGKIGYVPQSEILYGDLSLYDTLKYSLELFTKNLTEIESDSLIQDTLDILEINNEQETLIKNLSGGQRKRASIAIELLRNPKILFLDEPTSGLDSNIERKLMIKLKEISKSGKTIFLTAHTISNLALCDKIIFIGERGKICFVGTYEESLKYFKVNEFVQIYDILKENTNIWSEKYLKNYKKKKFKEKALTERELKNTTFLHQLKILVKRTFRLKFNNKPLLLMLFLQAPIMALLCYFATLHFVFDDYDKAKIVLFGLTCGAIWLGMFNTIQEICTERNIIKKEYMNNLNFGSYIVSKLFVLGCLCFIQAILFVSVDYFLIDFPREGILLNFSLIELIFNFFLVCFTSGCMGLFFSSIVKKIETTLVIIPIFMMFQLLFAGILIPLNNLSEKISYFMTARWSVEGFGIITNLESVADKTTNFVLRSDYVKNASEYFVYSLSHLGSVWLILLGTSLLFIMLSIILIKKNLKR